MFTLYLESDELQKSAEVNSSDKFVEKANVGGEVINELNELIGCLNSK